MDQQIINVLDDLSARFGVVIDWTSDNMLPYLEDLYSRLVKYLLLTKIFGIVICAIILFISVVYIYKFIKVTSVTSWYNMSAIAITIMVFAVCALFIAALVILILIQGIIGLYTIPEAGVLNYITNNYL